MPSRPLLLPPYNDFSNFMPDSLHDFNNFKPDRLPDFNKSPSDIFRDFHKSMSDDFRSSMIYGVAISILYIGAILLVAYLIYRCVREHGLPSINIKSTTNGAASTAELTQPLLPDSRIRNTTIEKFLDGIAGEKPIRFTSQQLLDYTHRRSATLGVGGFGAVYKGMLPNGINVAVKELHEHLEKTQEQFMAEVGTLWRTNHVNLIRLFGFCFDRGVMHALVLEFMEKGSLDKYLFNRRHAVGFPALRAIAIGVARGLRYLHEECQKKIIHYDIKADNVLLDDDLTPKITDFGIAQLLNRADAHVTVHELLGTYGHMAPEVGKGAVTEKCDVYSFGMLLFEIAGRRKNMDNDARDEQNWLPLLAWTKWESGELMDVVRKCHNLVAADEEQGKDTVERLFKVAFLCVQEQPEARPTMSEVVRMLEGEEGIPSLSENPFLHMYASPTYEHGSTSTEREESRGAEQEIFS